MQAWESGFTQHSEITSSAQSSLHPKRKSSPDSSCGLSWRLCSLPTTQIFLGGSGPTLDAWQGRAEDPQRLERVRSCLGSAGRSVITSGREERQESWSLNHPYCPPFSILTITDKHVLHQLSQGHTYLQFDSLCHALWLVQKHPLTLGGHIGKSITQNSIIHMFTCTRTKINTHRHSNTCPQVKHSPAQM